MKKIKNIKKFSLIILLVVLLIIAVTFAIIKITKTTKEASLNVKNSDNEKIEKIQETTEQLEIETEENVQENYTEDEQIKDDKKETINTENKQPYFIRVNYTQNVVTIYEKDSEGNYTKPIKAMLCSTGTSTPKSGTYSISDKYKWGRLFGGVSGQYCTRIVKSILFHSVPYITYGDKGSLEYWEYDKLGTTASAGCIRLTVEDAKWIYTNCGKGTQVEFYSDTNPGPLGKPTAQKISSEEAVRGWDPTDPDGNNPWKTYSKIEMPSNPSQNDNEQVIPENPTIPTEPEQKPDLTPTEPEDPIINDEEKPSDSENEENKPPEDKPDDEQKPIEPDEKDPNAEEKPTQPSEQDPIPEKPIGSETNGKS